MQKAVPGRKAGKGSIMQIDVNNLYQRKLLWNTPDGHVRSDKQDGDKTKVWEVGETPEQRGGGRGGEKD